MKPSETPKRTPLMEQYFAIKEQHPDTILLFQVGDFYELFFDDAKTAAAFLGITLTSRGKNNGDPIPLCGVPVHALDYYLVKLVRGGFRVALCDQLEQAQPGVVVRRGVTQVFTPGTLTDEKLLDQKSASYLFAFFPLKDQWGLLFGELMTGQLFVTTLPSTDAKLLDNELARFFPDEIVIPATREGRAYEAFFKQRGYYTSTSAHDATTDADAAAWLKKSFKPDAVSLVIGHEVLRSALTVFYGYLKKNQEQALEQFHALHYYKPDDYVLLDSATQRNLDLVRNSNDGSARHTLFSLLDRATTPMGSRLIKKWITRPLVKVAAIAQRADAIEYFKQHIPLLHQLEDQLHKVGDLERIVGRIALNRAQLHDYRGLSTAFGAIVPMRAALETTQISVLTTIATQLGSFTQLKQLLEAALDDTGSDDIIKTGFDQELDIIRQRARQSNEALLAFEQQEQAATGIQSLKVRFNNVHGYYIEITQANAHRVPEHYIRQQTLVGKERYMTQALQQLAGEIITAQATMESVEKLVYERVKGEVALHLTQLRLCAQAVAYLDALCAFAKLAWHNGYVRPTFNEVGALEISQGRHPVVEASSDHQFIPNDTSLNNDQSMWIITGPNMGGKSTYLRQVALISIMAQCGSFVPAAAAHLAILDRIFTRIGAGDNVAEGKSTFLVEMEETAQICRQATKNSLVILDEVGRGTSTFDGLAIAQAVIEYLYTVVQARCLFATHYHELTQLCQTYPAMASYYAASQQQGDRIVLLYKIVRGTADGSFGIEVAKVAQLPEPIIKRAQQLVTEFAQQETKYIPAHSAAVTSNDAQEIVALRQQLAAYQQREQRLLSVDYDNLTAKQAYDLIWSFKEN